MKHPHTISHHPNNQASEMTSASHFRAYTTLLKTTFLSFPPPIRMLWVNPSYIIPKSSPPFPIRCDSQVPPRHHSTFPYKFSDTQHLRQQAEKEKIQRLYDIIACVVSLYASDFASLSHSHKLIIILSTYDIRLFITSRHVYLTIP